MRHYANNCTTAPRERDRRLPRDHQQQERSPARFLARDEQNAFATKRMRMENLVNEKDVNSVGINTKKVYGLDPKKIQNSKITKLDSNSLVERILNEPAPITTRELLKIQPHLKSSIITRLNNLQKTKHALFSDDKSNRFSYIKTIINNQELIRLKLGYIPSKLDEKIMLTPIQGDPVEINDYVALPVEVEGIIVPITFLLMDPCASPILLGIDVLVQLRSVTNYDKQCLTLIVDDQPVQTQLYTKEDIGEGVGVHADDFDEPAFKFTESTLNDYFQNKKPKITGEEQDKLSTLLLSNSDLFAETFSDIPGIRDSDYDLILLDPTHVNPIKSKLKRYTTEERAVIKEEITKMLDAKIITRLYYIHITFWDFQIQCHAVRFDQRPCSFFSRHESYLL